MVLAQLRRLLVPQQTAEVSHARHGFLPGHQHVLLVSKRQKAMMVVSAFGAVVASILFSSFLFFSLLFRFQIQPIVASRFVLTAKHSESKH